MEERSTPSPMPGSRKYDATKLKLDSRASEATASHPKSGRMGKPKTRTGCITCKIRRIKCDEDKPYCKRCTLTGRQCDGYRQPQRPKGAASYPVQNAWLRPATAALQLQLVIKFNHHLPPQLTDHSDRTLCEHRSLEYFRCRTAAVMSEWLVENFWKYQLPQTANSEPATRHAMIALAKVHENIELRQEVAPNDPRLSPEVTASRMQYARQHYNIAVSELARALQERTDSEEVALMSCALFVIFNFISGNFTDAVFHMHNGIEIMSRWKASKVGTRALSEGSLEKNLITLFGRLSFQSSSLDDPLPEPEPDDPTVVSFPSLQAAKMTMNSLSRQGIRLVRIGAVLAHNSQAAERSDDLEIRASAHLVDLSGWLEKFKALVAILPTPYSIDDEGTIDMLRIMHVAAHIWIWVGLTPPEGPEPTSVLEQFLDLADEMHSKWILGLFKCPVKVHIFDTGLVPPLNFIARRSRNETLRAKAKMLLLKTAPLIVKDASSIPALKVLRDESPAAAPMVINIDAGMAHIGEQGMVEVEIEAGTRQVGISLKPRRSGDGWEVRKDFVV
ncbi:hypothetical protein EG329_000218 [Mollisiaceae sp. DMI_Dod_QoI]|nr:hypothetical protein EG329_000218 [Helotiales sp. DMI_Dod_QoI]